MDEGFFMAALWFLAGFFVVPWGIRFLLGYVGPLLGITGVTIIYVTLAIQALTTLLGFKWHSGFALGIGAATAIGILNILMPGLVPFM